MDRPGLSPCTSSGSACDHVIIMLREENTGIDWNRENTLITLCVRHLDFLLGLLIQLDTNRSAACFHADSFIYVKNEARAVNKCVEGFPCTFRGKTKITIIDTNCSHSLCSTTCRRKKNTLQSFCNSQMSHVLTQWLAPSPHSRRVLGLNPWEFACSLKSKDMHVEVDGRL